MKNVEYDVKDIATIVNGGYPDIRRVINGAQRQVVNSQLTIDENTIVQNDYKLEVLEILKHKTRKTHSKTLDNC